MSTELGRLQGGTTDEDIPGGMGTVRFIAICAGNATEILANVKQVLATALKLVESGVFQENIWLMSLPQQFVKNSIPHPSQAEMARMAALPLENRIRIQAESRWSVQMFMNCFLPDLGLRSWTWWDAIVLDQDHIAVAVEVEDWPFPWQSLRWLFRGAGALELDAEL